MLPWAHPSLQPRWHLDLFSHFCTAHGSVSSVMSRHVLSPKNLPLRMGNWTPSNTCFLGPTRVQKPNGISIGSAVFARLTAKCRRAFPGMPSPLTIAPSIRVSGPHLIHGSLSPPEPTAETASRSVQPFLHSSQQGRRAFPGMSFPLK